MKRIPRPTRRAMTLLVAAPFIVAACTTSASDDSAAEAVAAAPEPTSAVATVVPTATDEPVAETATWLDLELTDAETGDTFTLASLEGQIVAIEPMAIWCSNCLRQQKEVKALHEALGERDDLVTVVLDIDPNENAQNLKTYSKKNGFDWTYAVAPREVAREIGQIYGDQFLNPPSTPMLIIDRHGEAHPLPFGVKGAEELQEALAPFLSEGM